MACHDLPGDPQYSVLVHVLSAWKLDRRQLLLSIQHEHNRKNHC